MDRSRELGRLACSSPRPRRRRRRRRARAARRRLSPVARRPGGTSPFIEVRGGLVIEWRLACDGWLSRQRLAFVGTTEEGGDLSHDVRFSSWEALDGSRMRYTIRSYDDSGCQEEFRGEARLEPAHGGVANFSTPSEQEVELPPGPSSRPTTSSGPGPARAPASASSAIRCSTAAGSIR